MKILDTNVIIYLVNGQLAAPIPVQGYLVSVITKIELLGWKGLNPVEEKALSDVLSDVTVVQLDEVIVAKTIELRKTTNLRIPDAIIAATSITAGVALMTRDKSFDGVPGLKVEETLLK